MIERLTDPTLSAEASYQRMRDMLDGLHESDRGNLAEEWYFRRERPNAERHVKYEVDRPADEYNEARREGRFGDGVEGKTAIEVKDIEGRRGSSSGVLAGGGPGEGPRRGVGRACWLDDTCVRAGTFGRMGADDARSERELS